MRKLRGKRIVISGASSGIGLETAQRVVAEGGEACLVARRSEPLETAVREIGEHAWACPCDVADPESVSALAGEVRKRWGAIDGLVNNAGIAPMARLDETTDDMWEDIFAINVRGPFLLSRELKEVLQNGSLPSVVNISSTLAERPIPGMAAYNASKAALNQMTRSLALEWAPTVRVNAIMPAVVDTPIHSKRGMTSEQVQEMAAFHPLGRVGQPEDVAAMILFLLSGDSSWMTGTVIPVDGGALVG